MLTIRFNLETHINFSLSLDVKTFKREELLNMEAIMKSLSSSWIVNLMKYKPLIYWFEN